MFFIRPQTITEANLLSSSISESDPGAWSDVLTYAAEARVSVATGSTLAIYKSLVDDNLNNDPTTSPDSWVTDGTTYSVWDDGVSYALGDKVISLATHRIYESLAAGNLAHDPDDLANAAYWLDLAPTNRWAMFDSYNATQSVHPYRMDVTLQLTGRADAVALLNISNAVSVQVIVSTSADGEVFNQTYSLVSTEGIGDWYSYFFEDVQRLDTILISDLPAYVDPQVRVIVEGNGVSVVGLGLISAGLTKYLGETLHDNASVGITDYSRKEADEFGNYTIVPRAFSRRGTFSTRIRKSQVDGVHKVLSEYRTVPAVYCASTQYASTVIFGFFRDFQVDIDYPLESLISIELEGLT
jgi:hypothetical protein